MVKQRYAKAQRWRYAHGNERGFATPLFDGASGSLRLGKLGAAALTIAPP
jgi:hypothetical protein